MKDFISPLAAVLLSTSFISIVAADPKGESKLSDVLANLPASLENPRPRTALGEGDWASLLSCTADLDNQNPSLLDKDKCETAKDSEGQSCVWCDATATLGSGVCASPNQKAMLGGFWDQLCAAGGGTDPAPVDPPADNPPAPATSDPTPLPTPAPTAPAPAPDDNLPDSMKCLMDASSNLITDKDTCEAQKDGTSTSGENCVWCQVPIIGGSCITNSMQSSVSFLCRQEGGTTNYLRGDNSSVGGWKELDPTCLGDAKGLAGDRDSCATRTDSNGDGCMWCEAGDDVFGICATPSQKDYLGSYMDCADATTSIAAQNPIAVE